MGEILVDILAREVEVVLSTIYAKIRPKYFKDKTMEDQATVDLAQIAYEVYAEHQNWKNYAGQPIPRWADVRADIKSAWIAAISAVLDLRH